MALKNKRQVSRGQDERQDSVASDPQDTFNEENGGESYDLKNKKNKNAKNKKESFQARGKSKKNSENRLACILSFFTESDLRSKLFKWIVNIFIAIAILGVFALKGAEEYYSNDDDIGGQKALEHYTALELEDGSSEADVRKAYRTLSIRWHPDRHENCESCQARFQQVATAYEYLMKKFREKRPETNETNPSKKRRTNIDDYDSLGKHLESTSAGIIDLSSLGSDEPFYPALDTKHVWTIMIHQDKDEFSQQVYEMWQESARYMGKYVKYGVIIIRKNNKDVLKKLSMNIKVFPAILLLTGGMHPEQYTSIVRPSLETLNKFITDSFPSHLTEVTTASELQNVLQYPNINPMAPLSLPYKMVVLSSASSPSLLIKHTAFKTRESFQTILFTQYRPVTNPDHATIGELLNTPKSFITNTAGSSNLALPTLSDKFTKSLLDIHSTSLILYADEGQGAWIRHKPVQIIKAKHINPVSTIGFALEYLQESIQPLLFAQNARSLCRGTIQRHIFCLVVLEYSGTEQSDKKIDMSSIKKAISKSQKKYYLENPQKDLASLHIKQMVERHTSEENDSEEEADGDVETAQPLDEELEPIISIQVVRLSVSAPSSMPYLPGAENSSSFTQFLKNDLASSDAFLLDLQGDRFATVKVPIVGTDSNASISFLENIYQHLEEIEGSRKKHAEFKALPAYCSGNSFVSKCLPSATLPLHWRMYYYFADASIFLYLGFLSIIAGLIYFRKYLNAQMVFLVLGLSFVLGAISEIQTILNLFSLSKRH